MRSPLFAALALLFLVPGAGVLAQDVSLRVEPTSLDLDVGEEAQLDATVVGADGSPVEGHEIFFFSAARRSVAVDRQAGAVQALAPGDYQLIVISPGPEGFNDPGTMRVDIPVSVAFPPAAEIRTIVPDRLYAGTTVQLSATILTAGGLERTDLEPSYRSTGPDVLTIDDFGWATAMRPGRATVEISAGGVSTDVPVEVVENPVRNVELTVDRDRARTGDVLRFTAVPRDAAGAAVSDAVVGFSLLEHPVDTLLAPPSSAQVAADGRFVAEKPGIYTVVANSGPTSSRMNVSIEWRDVEQEVELIGHGTVGNVHTSDLWVWEGPDGRDYAITGTWGGSGLAYFWDVTDFENPVRIDSIQVDARTVNDVKISENGRVGVISREGASTRRNGIVILDVSDPANVEILSEFDDELTGGVHNVFVSENHVYAVNNGRRYDIINIEDPTNPHRVGRFELETPGHSVHDVWVDDGIAYSSNWSDGVVLVDVGNGIRGGSPSNPVMIGSYAYPSGANHAAFPYRSESTGKNYVIAGDEIMPECGNPNLPCTTRGYIHFIDFSDSENPHEVARYQVPEAGTHNFWVEGDRLFIAYYNGGLRVVDISGELMGDLYRQGREVARYLSWDGEGFVPNAPMAWGPQPYKGHIFFSDFNSGLWSVRLKPQRELVP